MVHGCIYHWTLGHHNSIGCWNRKETWYMYWGSLSFGFPNFLLWSCFCAHGFLFNSHPYWLLKSKEANSKRQKNGRCTASVCVRMFVSGCLCQAVCVKGRLIRYWLDFLQFLVNFVARFWDIRQTTNWLISSPLSKLLQKCRSPAMPQHFTSPDERCN